MLTTERCVRTYAMNSLVLATAFILLSPTRSEAQHAGEIRIVAFNFAPRNWESCDGQELPIETYPQLFEAIGTTFGGDGKKTFAVPNLRGNTPLHPGTTDDVKLELGQKIGGLPVVKTEDAGVAATTTLALHFVIATRSEPYGFSIMENNIPPGEIRFFAGSQPPDGWMFCNGQRLQVEEYPLLFNEIGATFGGDEKTWFIVPDMRGRTAYGVGPTRTRVTKPQRVIRSDDDAASASTLSGVGLNYMIRVGPVGKGWAAAVENQREFDFAYAKYAVTEAKAKVASANRELVESQLRLIRKYPKSASADVQPAQLNEQLEPAIRAEKELLSKKRREYDALRELSQRPRLLPPDTTIGEIRILAGRTTPTGWLPCNGRKVLINGDTHLLFSLFGTMYGGDGRTVFSIPDLLHRAPIHATDRQKQGEVGGELSRFEVQDRPQPKQRTTWTTSMVPLRYFVTPVGVFPTEN